MPKEIAISKDMIIDAGFEMAQEHGISSLSARKIATKLNCSTMPIYSQFKSFEELIDNILNKAIANLWICMNVEYDETFSFFNMGVGYIIFARDNPELFKALFLESNRYQSLIDEFTNTVVDKMQNDPRFTDWNVVDIQVLFNKLYIFTHGYATMLSVKTIKHETDEEIMKLLNEVGTTIILNEFSTKNE